jgi:hypothetical protein
MTNEDGGTSVNAQLYFAVLPEWVLYLPISANAVRLYCVLRRFADNTTGECFPSRKTLAMKARTSVQTVDRCIKELVEHGALKVRPRKNAAGDWSSNTYTVMSYPQGYQGVAKKLGIPLLTGDETGTPKTRARTKAIMNEKQELPKYDLRQQQNASLGAALFHTGRTLSEVKYEAIDAWGNVRQETIDIFLSLCSLNKVDPEVGKCSRNKQNES